MIYKNTIVVVGGGIAGCTAAIYAGMSGKNVILIMGYMIGGLISTTKIVDNYTGLPGIDGFDMADKITKHAAKYAKVLYESVKHIDVKTKIITTENTEIKADSIIIATGSSPKKLNLKSEFHFENRGVSYCAICDGYFFKNKNVAVIGGGNSAFEQVKYLSTLCSNVYLIHRSDKFRAFAKIQEEVKSLPNVKIIVNEEVQEFVGEDDLKSIKLKHQNLEVSGAFIAIGHIPNSSFIEGVEKKDGYICVNKDYETSTPGIFACGDVIDQNLVSRYKQAIIAGGEGCVAALKSCEYVDCLD